MCSLNAYQDEPKKLNVVAHLEELRRRILAILIFLGISFIFFFANGKNVLLIAEIPLRGLVRSLVYLSPTEAFTAYFKCSLLAGVIVTFPYILYQAWLFVAPAVPLGIRKRVVGWFISAFFLFILGALFSYFVALPMALRFLVTFGNEIAFPQITLGNYISFFGAFMLIGALVFEIPIVVAILSELGFVTSGLLKQKRHYALVFILIIAAVITPTQDVINLMIFAVPMAVLYEIGIFVAGAIESRKRLSFTK